MGLREVKLELNKLDKTNLLKHILELAASKNKKNDTNNKSIRSLEKCNI